MSKKIFDTIAKVGNSLRNNSQFIVNPKSVKADLEKTKFQKADDKKSLNMLEGGVERLQQKLQKFRSAESNSKFEPVKPMKQQTDKLRQSYLDQIRNFSERNIQNFKSQNTDQKPRWKKMYNSMETIKSNISKLNGSVRNEKVELRQQRKQEKSEDSSNQLENLSPQKIQKSTFKITELQSKWAKLSEGLKSVKQNLQKLKPAVRNQKVEFAKQTSQKTEESTHQLKGLSIKNQQPNSLKEQLKVNDSLKITRQGQEKLRTDIASNQIEQKIRQNNQIQINNQSSQNVEKMIIKTKQNFFTVQKFLKDVIQASKNVRDKSSNQQRKTKQKIANQNEYLKQMKSAIKDQRARFQKLKQKSQQQLKSKSKQSLKWLSSAKESFSNKRYSKFNYFENLISKLFFRAALLVFFAMLAYGIGSSIPREIRLYLSSSKESNQLVKGDSAAQAANL